MLLVTADMLLHAEDMQTINGFHKSNTTDRHLEWLLACVMRCALKLDVLSGIAFAGQQHRQVYDVQSQPCDLFR